MLAVRLISAMMDALLGLWEKGCLFVGLNRNLTIQNRTDTTVTLAYGSLVLTDSFTQEVRRLAPGEKLEGIWLYSLWSGPSLLWRHRIEARDPHGTLVFCREYSNVAFRLRRQIVITRRITCCPLDERPGR